MDLQKILAELIAERKRLDEAIAAIERMVHAGGQVRGRRPKQANDNPADPSVKPPGPKKG